LPALSEPPGGRSRPSQEPSTSCPKPDSLLNRRRCLRRESLAYAEAGFRPLDHRLRRPHLRLPDGSGGLDVDDHAVIGVDQIIGGVPTNVILPIGPESTV
jgi:hypothetical protein